MTLEAASPIEVDEDGIARIAGTPIRVADVARLKQTTGMTPEQMQAVLPSLNLAQIYGALSYYDAHQEAMDKAEEARQAAVEQALSQLKPRHSPPSGENWLSLVAGQWPGDETDEEISAALERMKLTPTALFSPRYLLDTNILVRYVRQDALALWMEATYALRSAATLPLISIVSGGEIRSLALQFGWGAAKKHVLTQLLQDCLQVSLDLPGLVDAYAEIDAFNLTIGRAMGDNDVWIAATAKVTGARLLTTDKDFDHLDPLHLQRDWIDPTSKLPGTP